MDTVGGPRKSGGDEEVILSGATLSIFTLYQDPEAAVRFLEQGFGFETVNQYPDEGGTVHAELRLGNAVVIVERGADGQDASPVVDSSTVRAPVLVLDDDPAAVDAIFDRAVAAGARVLRSPEDTEWGNHRFEVLDPEGHQWSVGTYTPGTTWTG